MQKRNVVDNFMAFPKMYSKPSNSHFNFLKKISVVPFSSSKLNNFFEKQLTKDVSSGYCTEFYRLSGYMLKSGIRQLLNEWEAKVQYTLWRRESRKTLKWVHSQKIKMRIWRLAIHFRKGHEIVNNVSFLHFCLKCLAKILFSFEFFLFLAETSLLLHTAFSFPFIK